MIDRHFAEPFDDQTGNDVGVGVPDAETGFDGGLAGDKGLDVHWCLSFVGILMIGLGRPSSLRRREVVATFRRASRYVSGPFQRGLRTSGLFIAPATNSSLRGRQSDDRARNSQVIVSL